MLRTKAKQRGFGTQWLLIGAAASITLAAGIAIWLGNSRPAGDATAPTSSNSATDLGEKKAIDWDRPISGTYVDTLDQAAADVSFAPSVPRGLGNPLKIMVDNPSGNHAGRTVAFVYQHPTYGRFFVIEGFTSWTQSSLSALATCDPNRGCEGQRAIVTLQSGATGVLITGGPTTGILWLSAQGLTFNVYGPIDTFSVNSAKAVANSV